MAQTQSLNQNVRYSQLDEKEAALLFELRSKQQKEYLQSLMKKQSSSTVQITSNCYNQPNSRIASKQIQNAKTGYSQSNLNSEVKKKQKSDNSRQNLIKKSNSTAMLNDKNNKQSTNKSNLHQSQQSKSNNSVSKYSSSILLKSESSVKKKEQNY